MEHRRRRRASQALEIPAAPPISAQTQALIAESSARKAAGADNALRNRRRRAKMSSSRIGRLQLAAHRAVAAAIRRGELEKQPCERCGAKKVDAHHENYERPLEVVWLCRPCHNKVPRSMRYWG